MDTAKGNKLIKNPSRASLRKKIKIEDKTIASNKLKSGPPSKKQKKILKPATSINKIAIKKEVSEGDTQQNKVAKSMHEKQSSVKRINSIKKES